LSRSNLSAVRVGLPSGKNFYLGLLAAIGQTLFALALLATSAWLISRAAEQPPVMYLMIAVVGVRGFALGRASFRYLERLLLHDAAFSLLGDLRPKLFSKLIPLVPSQLNLSRADISTRLVNDVDDMQNLSLRILSPILQATAVCAASVALFWTWSPAAAMWLATCIVLAVFIALPASAALAKDSNYDHASMRSKANENAALLVENLDVLQSFDWLASYRAEYEFAQVELNRSSKRQALAIGIGQSLLAATAIAATCGSAYIAAQQVLADSIPGVMLAVLALAPLAVFDALGALQTVHGAWQRYRASSERIIDLLNSVPGSLIATSGGTRLPSDFETLELRDLCARYPASDSVAVANVNLKLVAGQNLLITGKSGAGKSTIAHVLLAFLNPVSGSYLINGIDHAEIESNALRNLIGYQQQSPTIFSGTLRANLLLAKPDASDQQLISVLDRVNLAKVFASREGLDTELGETGFAISGGEAQRVSLARLLLADFKVLIFDEPTANVDPENASELIADLLAIAKADKRRAAIFISHDPKFEHPLIDVRVVI